MIESIVTLIFINFESILKVVGRALLKHIEKRALRIQPSSVTKSDEINLDADFPTKKKGEYHGSPLIICTHACYQLHVTKITELKI